MMVPLLFSSVALLLLFYALLLQFSLYRFKAAKVTDTRVKLMSEVINGIRVIKMYGWEYAFSRLITKIRKYGVSECYNNVIFRINLSFSIKYM